MPGQYLMHFYSWHSSEYEAFKLQLGQFLQLFKVPNKSQGSVCLRETLIELSSELAVIDSPVQRTSVDTLTLGLALTWASHFKVS